MLTKERALRSSEMPHDKAQLLHVNDKPLLMQSQLVFFASLKT
jgi:hypothetical protein